MLRFTFALPLMLVPALAMAQIAGNTLAAPTARIAVGRTIDVVLPSVQCGRTYLIQSSADHHHWKTVGRSTFEIIPDRDPELGPCANDFIDSNVDITPTTKTIYYRYHEMKNNQPIRSSEIGVVDVTHLR